jgi:hypothetical protein
MMIEKKSWQEFRETSLLLLVNQFLHIFGWALVVDVEKNEEGDFVHVNECYPARTEFRGFSAKSVTAAYEKVSQYMVQNAEKLLEEARS